MAGLGFGTSERFFYQFTKPFQEFELLPGAAEWYMAFDPGLFFKTDTSWFFTFTIDKIIHVSIALA